MNKRQHKKRLKNEAKLAEISAVLEATRQNFHRELLLIARYADKRLAVKKHFEIADEYSEMRCYHEKEQLKRTINELEAAIYTLKSQEKDFDICLGLLGLFTALNVMLFIVKWLTGG